jgi:hypothetical protein
MSIYHLYVKTHNQTKLKYLGQTIQDPYWYLGSGIEWLKHLKEYGNDISTDIIGSYNTKEELREVALLISKEFDIVNSSDWANMVPEYGVNPNLDPNRSKDSNAHCEVCRRPLRRYPSDLSRSNVYFCSVLHSNQYKQMH